MKRKARKPKTAAPKPPAHAMALWKKIRVPNGQSPIDALPTIRQMKV